MPVRRWQAPPLDMQAGVWSEGYWEPGYCRWWFADVWRAERCLYGFCCERFFALKLFPMRSLGLGNEFPSMSLSDFNVFCIDLYWDCSFFSKKLYWIVSSWSFFSAISRRAWLAWNSSEPPDFLFHALWKFREPSPSLSGEPASALLCALFTTTLNLFFADGRLFEVNIPPFSFEGSLESSSASSSTYLAVIGSIESFGNAFFFFFLGFLGFSSLSFSRRWFVLWFVPVAERQISLAFF